MLCLVFLVMHLDRSQSLFYFVHQARLDAPVFGGYCLSAYQEVSVVWIHNITVEKGGSANADKGWQGGGGVKCWLLLTRGQGGLFFCWRGGQGGLIFFFFGWHDMWTAPNELVFSFLSWLWNISKVLVWSREEWLAGDEQNSWTEQKLWKWAWEKDLKGPSAVEGDLLREMIKVLGPRFQAYTNRYKPAT